MSLRPPLPRPRKTTKQAQPAVAPKRPGKPKPKPGNCRK